MVYLSRTAVLWLLVLASLFAGHLLMTGLDVGIGDEDVHRFQINWFIEGRFELFQHVTVLPLYHGVVAALGRLTGLTSLDGLRLVHLVFAALAIPAFFRLCRALYREEAVPRSLQFLWLPLLFPLFFVTYTDLPALAFTLLMLERTLARHYGLAGLFALLAVAMRQPNIAWVGFALALVALQTARDRGFGLLGAENLVESARRGRPLLVVMLAFLVFLIWNGGVAVGDADQHRLSLNPSNLYFCLLVAWALFLPFAVEQLGDIRHLLARYRWIWGLLAAAFVVYFFTYTAGHTYNSPELAFYRHNLILHYTVDFTVGRVLAFVPMAWMALAFASAARTSDHRREMLLLVPFALLSFLPMPLIEPRYYLPALCLFLAFRPPMSRTATAVTLVYYAAASGWILYNISRQNFFL